MSSMDNKENVKKQYSDDENLAVRMSLHDKYSTNKQGLVPWLFEQYHFESGFCILEMGCGNGRQWEGKIGSLPKACHLILSDFSDGMVELVKERYSKYNNVSFEIIDIQNINYPDETFDMVIANHMLYHVPDLPRALQEVNRVLKIGGKFYCTTNGNGGIRRFLSDSMKMSNASSTLTIDDFSFHLQNGRDMLEKYFSEVRRVDYEDSLLITDTQDLIKWMKSTISIAAYSEKEIDGMFDYFEAVKRKDGAINIPKECGLFIAIK